MLLPPSRDVAVDPPPAERAKIGSRAVTGVGRDFLRIALEIGLDGIEQRSELRLIAPIGVEGVRHDDLRRRIDRGLRVVALDVAVFGLQGADVRIGEVALALAVGLILECAGVLPLFLRPSAMRRSSASARRRVSSSAAALACASSSAFAARILASRFSLSATQSGISSPRLSP